MNNLYFEYNGIINNQQSWVAVDNDNTYVISWNPGGYWSMSGWPYGGEPRNNTPPPNLPTSGWYIFGSTYQVNFNINAGGCNVTQFPTQTVPPTPTPTPSPTLDDICVIINVPTSTPTPTPTPSKTSTPTPTPTPSSTSLLPTLTLTPTPGPTNSALDTCPIIIIGSDNKTYFWNTSNNTLNEIILPGDFAYSCTSYNDCGIVNITFTKNKIWKFYKQPNSLYPYFKQPFIIEWDFNYVTQTATYNRTLTFSVNFGTWANRFAESIFAIADDKLILGSGDYLSGQNMTLILPPSPQTIIDRSLSIDLYDTPEMFMKYSMLKTTNNKLIMLGRHISQGPGGFSIPNDFFTDPSSDCGPFISQYDLNNLTSFAMVAEYVGRIPKGYNRMAMIGNYLYVFSNYLWNANEVCCTATDTVLKIDLNNPSLGYTPVTFPSPIKVFAASSLYECNTNSFSRNVVCQTRLPLTGETVTYNGISMVGSGSGAVVNFTNRYPNVACSNASLYPNNPLYIYNNSVCLNCQQGVFDYTVTFNTTINNLILNLAVINIGDDWIFNTDGGTTTLTILEGCGATTSGNQIIINTTSVGSCNSLKIKITSQRNYSYIRITPPNPLGNGNGMSISVDCDSLVPVVPFTPTPTPTPYYVINPQPSICSSCITYPLKYNYTGLTYNNLSLTTSISYFPFPESTGQTILNCTDVSGTQYPTVFLNDNYVYRIKFNQPVNNVKFLFTMGGNSWDPNLYERHIFSTNVGTPNLSICGRSCGSRVNGNVFESKYGNGYGQDGGSALVEVRTPTPYTEIIISGQYVDIIPGMYVSICLSVTPGSSPTPTPTPSYTPFNFATPTPTPTPTPTSNVTGPTSTPTPTPSYTPFNFATPTPSPSNNSTPTPSSTPSNQPLFDRSSFIGRVSDPYLTLLNQSCTRWETYVKFNSSIYTSIQTNNPGWNGIRLYSYNLYYDSSSTTIASCGVAQYVDIGSGNSVKFNTFSFILNINDYWRNRFSTQDWINVLTHELGHAIGIGTFWQSSFATNGAVPPVNNFLNGTAYNNAQNAYNSIVGQSRTQIPLEATGGSGTQSAHWENDYRSSTVTGTGAVDYYGVINELMVGYYAAGLDSKLSRLSVKTCVDFGYEEVSVGNSEGDPRIDIALVVGNNVMSMNNNVISMNNIIKLNCGCDHYISNMEKIGTIYIDSSNVTFVKSLPTPTPTPTPNEI